jgi:hypothetical protein
MFGYETIHAWHFTIATTTTLVCSIEYMISHFFSWTIRLNQASLSREIVSPNAVMNFSASAERGLMAHLKGSGSLMKQNQIQVQGHPSHNRQDKGDFEPHPITCRQTKVDRDAKIKSMETHRKRPPVTSPEGMFSVPSSFRAGPIS